MMAIVSDNTRKRKRTANTSNEQVEEYLRQMESDEIFRTNTINPTVDPDYINNIWKKLCQKLNSCDCGPVLATKEWIKRFNDWKNNTRAKYRRVVESRLKTGGGEGEPVKLSPQEERGLTVWGKVAVTGSTKVLVVGGLQHLAPYPSLTSAEDLSPEASFCQEAVKAFTDEGVSKLKKVDLTKELKETKMHTRAAKNQSIRNRPIRESRSIKMIGEELLSEYRQSNLNQHQLQLEQKKIELEVSKFKFEVAKYKFENPTFSFDVDC